MKIVILLIIVIILVLILLPKKTGMEYTYQEPSPVGIYTTEDCLVACSEKKGVKEYCDWCKQNTPLLGMDQQNMRRVFINYPSENL